MSKLNDQQVSDILYEAGRRHMKWNAPHRWFAPAKSFEYNQCRSWRAIARMARKLANEGKL